MPRSSAAPDARAREEREVARFFLLFGHPLRLRMLQLIAEERSCQCEMAAHLGAHPVNVSRHLAVLGKAGLITMRRKGKKIYPRISRPAVLGLLELARLLAKEIAASPRKPD